VALAAGSRLGPYEVLTLIGAGGMGEVYRARDTRLDRTVAVKLLPADLNADPDRRARFEREARTIAQLAHPHICTLYDVGRQDETTHLVMEHLAGETLAAATGAWRSAQRVYRTRAALPDYASRLVQTRNWRRGAGDAMRSVPRATDTLMSRFRASCG
jgi:serine/threonine protein kinase